MGGPNWPIGGLIPGGIPMPGGPQFCMPGGPPIPGGPPMPGGPPKGGMPMGGLIPGGIPIPMGGMPMGGMPGGPMGILRKQEVNPGSRENGEKHAETSKS